MLKFDHLPVLITLVDGGYQKIRESLPTIFYSFVAISFPLLLFIYYCYYQGRNEVRWRPGQEASLAPPCSKLRSFGSKCTVLMKVLVTLLGLFGAPPIDSAPGELCPPCLSPSLRLWLLFILLLLLILSKMEPTATGGDPGCQTVFQPLKALFWQKSKPYFDHNVEST